MHDEGIWPGAALRLALRAISGSLAERGRPRECENVEVEFAGLVLPGVLSRSGRDKEARRQGGEEQRTHEPDHGRPLPRLHREGSLAKSREQDKNKKERKRTDPRRALKASPFCTPD